MVVKPIAQILKTTLMEPVHALVSIATGTWEQALASMLMPLSLLFGVNLKRVQMPI